MNGYHAREIDWSACEIREISASARDLPPNISVLQADFLNAATLKRAIAIMCQSPVQVVQIETPFSEEAQEIAKLFAAQTKLKGGTQETMGSESFQAQFERYSLHPGGHEFLQRCDALPKSVTEAGRTLFGVALYGSSITNVSQYKFHVHGNTSNRPTWLLNTALGRKATVFVDSRQLTSECLGPRFMGFEVNFETPNPALWEAKPYTASLFTAGHHPQGNAAHSPPIQEGPEENRLIIAANFA